MKDFLDLEHMEDLAKCMVDIIKEKAEDFPYASMKAVDLLSKVYQALGEFKKAAYILSSFKFDQYRLTVTPAEKVAWMVNTAGVLSGY